jgi:hypothetical protein
MLARNPYAILDDEQVDDKPLEDEPKILLKKDDEFKLLNNIMKYYPYFERLSSHFRGYKYILMPNPKWFEILKEPLKKEPLKKELLKESLKKSSHTLKKTDVYGAKRPTQFASKLESQKMEKEFITLSEKEIDELKEMKNFYAELLKGNINYKNILGDYIRLYGKTNEQISKIEGIQLSLFKDGKSRIILRRDILDNIQKKNLYDFESDLKRFLTWVEISYSSYMGLSVREIINKSSTFVFNDISYKKNSGVYDKFLMIKEIRAYQIKLYYKIYEVILQYYETKEDNNLAIIINEFNDEYLRLLYEKYSMDEKNKDIMTYFMKNKFFVNFCTQIEMLVQKFSVDYEYYKLSNNVFFDTIKSSYYLKRYLYILFCISTKTKQDMENYKNTPILEKYLKIKDNIDKFVNITNNLENIELFSYDETKQRYILSLNFNTNIKAIIRNKFIDLNEKLNGIDLKFIIFLSHFIYYEVLLLNGVDHVKEPILSKIMHKEYRNNEFYNISLTNKYKNRLGEETYEKKYKLDVDEVKPLLLLGTRKDIINYVLDVNDYYCLIFIADLFNYEQLSDLIIYNPTLNDLCLLSEVKKKDKLPNPIALFINDNENKIWRYKEYDKKYISDTIDNYTYIGLLQIVTKEDSFRTIDVILCYDNKNKNFCLFDVMGNRILWGTILYETQFSYRELLHLNWWGCKFFSHKDDKLLKYIYVGNETFNKENYREIYLKNFNSKIDWYDKAYITFTEKPIKQSGGNNINNLENIIKIENKKLVKYYNKFYHIIKKIKKQNTDLVKYYLLLFNNYEYLYSENRYFMANNNFNDISYILNYKIISVNSLFFIELQFKYNIIENNFKNIYEISNGEFIGDCIQIINDKLTKNYTLKSLYLDYLVNLNNNKKEYIYIKQEEIKKQYGTDKKDNIISIEFFNILSKIKLINEINRINNIDCLILNIRICREINIYVSNYISKLYILYIFNLIKSKLNIGSNLIIIINAIKNNFAVKIITLFCSLYEEYYITTADTNTDRPQLHIILKHKKENIIANKILDRIQEKINKDCPNMGVDENYNINGLKNSDEINNHILNFSKNETYIEDIELKDKNLIKLYKKIKKEIINFNTNFYFNLYNLYKKIYHNIKHNIKYTDEEEKLIREKNLYACIQWSKKYEVPLIPEIDFDSFGDKIKHKIFSDIVSFEKDIIITLKNHDKNIIDFKTNNDYDDIPKYFKRAIVKFNLETRALDKRPMNIYHQVKVRIDYYYKKLTKEVVQRYKLSNDYVSNAWLKMTELLNKVDLINKKATKIKTFHICELPGSFINAIRFYINTKTDIKDFYWKAQSLNPDRDDKDSDERIAFGDEANMLKKYPNNYDFGYNKSGDITDYKNIEYYRKKYNDNDFVTADCGLPYSQKVLSNALTYAQYLMVFSCCKIGGNCAIKRWLPIENTQEIYMLYLFYCVFDKVIIYKPKLNYQSQEYYLCGINYLGIDKIFLDELIEYLKNYKLDGFPKNIPDSFLLQIDKAQHELLDIRNDFIRKKIYFCDKFELLSNDDWDNINKACKSKIKEWFESVGL